MKLRDLDPVEVIVWSIALLSTSICLAASVSVIRWAVA